MSEPSSGLVGLASSVGNSVGRHFGLTTALPSLFLTVWVYGLIAARPWSVNGGLGVALAALAELNPVKVTWLVAASLLVGLFLHPLEFAGTQLLEGYWGTGRLSRILAGRRVRHHRRLYRGLRELEGHEASAWKAAVNEMLGPGDHTAEERDTKLASAQGDAVAARRRTEEEARRLAGRYPGGERIMPTRLGNALRQLEDGVGAQYGLDVLRVAPHLALIAPDRHLAYLNDARQQLDLAVRLCTVCLLASVVSVAALLPDGLWLFVTLVPYVGAYVAYRGAVVAALGYGTVVATVLDLNRFELYRILGLVRPSDTSAERDGNRTLGRLLAGDDEVFVQYRDC